MATRRQDVADWVCGFSADGGIVASAGFRKPPTRLGGIAAQLSTYKTFRQRPRPQPTKHLQPHLQPLRRYHYRLSHNVRHPTSPFTDPLSPVSHRANHIAALRPHTYRIDAASVAAVGEPQNPSVVEWRAEEELFSFQEIQIMWNHKNRTTFRTGQIIGEDCLSDGDDRQ